MLKRHLTDLVAQGVVDAATWRSGTTELRDLLRHGWLVRRRKGRRVFYEWSSAAIPLLDQYRLTYLHQAQAERFLHPRSRQLKALLEDLRFLDTRSDVAKRFRFLGDWQLHEPVTARHLELAKLRFYEGALNAA